MGALGAILSPKEANKDYDLVRLAPRAGPCKDLADLENLGRNLAGRSDTPCTLKAGAADLRRLRPAPGRGGSWGNLFFLCVCVFFMCVICFVLGGLGEGED